MEAPKVQHVTKASSDELLRKFAADIVSDSDNEACSASAKRKKPSQKKKQSKKSKKNNERGDNEDQDQNGNGSLRIVERKSLLPHQRARRSGSVFRHLAISRSHHLRGCRDFRGAIEKTWSKAVRGASKVFMEKHYNRHRLLSNDIV